MPARDERPEPIDGELPIVVAALYRFVPLPDFQALRPSLESILRLANVKGSLLLAAEGINGTIAGSPSGVNAVLAHLKKLPEFEGLEVKTSSCAEQPFRPQSRSTQTRNRDDGGRGH